MQTRKQSLIETTTSVLIGFLVALAIQMAIFPIFGIYVPFSDNLLIGLWFTAVSIVRGYAVRRYFNRGKKWNSKNVDNAGSLLNEMLSTLLQLFVAHIAL